MMNKGVASLLGGLRLALKDFSRLLLPLTCEVCGRSLVDGEVYLCLECRCKIPRTDYHLRRENPLLTKLASVVAPLECAASFFHYAKGNPYGMLLQEAKYNGRPDIDRLLAREYASEIRFYGFFDGIDCIIPVPVHWFKYLKRGFNQSDYIARGVSEATGIPVVYNLRAHRPHSTQTRKHARERRQSLESVFALRDPESLLRECGRSSGQGSGMPDKIHILLVDDVITTGSTILSCAAVIFKAFASLPSPPAVKISVLSLATTSLR